MQIKRSSIFYGILAFLLLVNILLIFDLNQFYIRPILGFIFLITIPGLLLMLIFRIRSVGFWEYLVYTIGLSVAFIMFAGLLVNWDLPFLGITDKPLSLIPILVSFDILLLIMWVYAILRNADLKPLEIKPIKLDTRNKIFFIIPMIFPVLSILGAFLLNNHGPNILTMIMLGGIALYVLFLVLHRDKLNENVFPWAILMISVSLLLMFSLRSWYISGWDVSQEQYVFRLAYENQIWSLHSYNDPYNSCLSLSVLPTTIKIFVNSNLQLIYKLFFQIIFIFHSLTIFLIFRRYIKHIFAFIASFLYFGAGYFNAGFPSLIRQEIAFLFFGLMLLVLFNKNINPIMKKSLFIIFGISMIVSHYSTSYVALAFFLFAYILVFIYKSFEKRKIKKGKISAKEKTEFELTLILVLLLLIFSFLWYMQVTDTGKGLISTIKVTVQNMGGAFSYDLKQSSVKEALFGKSAQIAYTNAELSNYINETKSSIPIKDVYSEDQVKDYSPRIANREVLYSRVPILALPLAYLYKIIKYLIIISFVIGSVFIFFNKKKFVDKEFSFMVAISVIFMFLIILLPFVSKAYGFERLLQQCLIFLSFSSLIFFKTIMKNFKKTFIFFVIFLYIGYSFFNLYFLVQLTGGEPGLNLYNNGYTYNTAYSHGQEVISINWLNKSYEKYTIYMDPYSNLKFFAFGNPKMNIQKKIIPVLMNPSSYVYANTPNIVRETNFLDAREKFNSGVLLFNFPTEFLNENKNKIYDNGGSEIFK